jgi:hypothetical protein
MVLKFPLLQLINKYTSVAFMQVVRTPVSLSDVGAGLNLEAWIVSNYF